MIYYSYFSGHGRAILADELNASDPFALSPAEIIERILMAGYTPNVGCFSSEPWPQAGAVTEVRRDGQSFRVGVSRDAERISLQEVRYSGYDRMTAAE